MWLPDDIEIDITIPEGPFRIHPDASRTVGPLLCTYALGAWWLAHPDGVSPAQLGPSAWTNLYEGVLDDGRPFLMPVFRYADGSDDVYDRLSEAVRLARSQWVSIEGDVHANTCRIVPDDTEWPDPGCWSGYALADLVDIGFGGRYLGSWHDIAVRLLGAREFVVHYPRSDYFSWMRSLFDPEGLQFDDERYAHLI